MHNTSHNDVHDRSHMKKRIVTRSITDRGAVALSLLALGLLRFLRGTMGMGGKVQKNMDKPPKQERVIEEKVIKAKVPVAPKVAVEEVKKKAEVVEVVEVVEVKKEATLPAWFTYLRENEYTDSEIELTAFESDKIVTRATSTPFLARYGFINKLEEKQSEACTFPDIAAKSEQMKATILASCKFDLLRGSNGNFIPDRNMTKAEMITVLVRTKTGYLAEDTTPWFKNYLEYAQTNGIVDSEAKIDNFEGTVMKKELGQWLYRLSQIK